jgi:sialate O-acetylesterase
MVYHAMVAPLLNYRIRGVAWSQGESNGEVGRASTYGTLFPTLIESWRAEWGQGDFPFLFVQVAPNRKKRADPNVLSGMAEVREAQRLTSLRVPRTAMVVTTDLGDANGQVQYRRKKPAGERLVLAALALAYDREVESSGPAVESVAVDGNKAFIRFAHAGAGLRAGEGRLTGFTIAGPNRRFVVAEAGIEGDTVVVSSPKVVMPVAVRHGWADYPVVNLTNSAGLPASPFRTDQFPLVPLKEEAVAMKKGTGAARKGAAESKKSTSPRLPGIQPRIGDRQSSSPASR